MTDVRLNRLHYPVSALGPGVRLGVWFQGCTIECLGCVSRDTWDSRAAPTRTVAEIVGQSRALVDGPVHGVTFTGGEPFEQPAGLAALSRAMRVEFPECDLLAYSGYELDHLQRVAAPALSLLDAVITGPYRAGNPSSAAWWGSGNQVLTRLTDLGSARYASVPNSPQLQAAVDPDGSVWVIGVPPRGVLGQVERDLRASGVLLEEVSWRP